MSRAERTLEGTSFSSASKNGTDRDVRSEGVRRDSVSVLRSFPGQGPGLVSVRRVVPRRRKTQVWRRKARVGEVCGVGK